MTGQTQLEILKEAVELLGNLAEGSGKRFSTVKQKDIRRSFINRHAWNVHDITHDVLVLGEHGDLRSIYLLSRPALESLFKLAATVATPDFAAQKVVAEVQEEQEKVKRWLEARPAWKDVLTQVEAALSEYEQDLRTRYGVKGDKKWKPYQVANEGKMSASYHSCITVAQRGAALCLSMRFLRGKLSGRGMSRFLTCMTIQRLNALTRGKQAKFDAVGARVFTQLMLTDRMIGDPFLINVFKKMLGQAKSQEESLMLLDLLLGCGEDDYGLIVEKLKRIVNPELIVPFYLRVTVLYFFRFHRDKDRKALRELLKTIRKNTKSVRLLPVAS